MNGNYAQTSDRQTGVQRPKDTPTWRCNEDAIKGAIQSNSLAHGPPLHVRPLLPLPPLAAPPPHAQLPPSSSCRSPSACPTASFLLLPLPLRMPNCLLPPLAAPPPHAQLPPSSSCRSPSACTSCSNFPSPRPRGAPAMKPSNTRMMSVCGMPNSRAAACAPTSSGIYSTRAPGVATASVAASPAE